MLVSKEALAWRRRKIYLTLTKVDIKGDSLHQEVAISIKSFTAYFKGRIAAGDEGSLENAVETMLHYRRCYMSRCVFAKLAISCYGNTSSF